MSEQNTRLGILLMIATSIIFAIQDGISRHLAGEYNVYMIVMIRYWFLAVFVAVVAARKAGGMRRAVTTHFPVIQVIRGLLLALEICVTVTAFVRLGLIASHAVFACYPLLIAALARLRPRPARRAASRPSWGASSPDRAAGLRRGSDVLTSGRRIGNSPPMGEAREAIGGWAGVSS